MDKHKEDLQSSKRFHGEFYTPIIFADKAYSYIENYLGKDFLSSSNYRIWDCGCGQGNLVQSIPPQYRKYVYMSTLYQHDVDYCIEHFDTSLAFQYDYLNDDVQNIFNSVSLDDDSWKLPKTIRSDLQNKEIKWIIFINPPYATSQAAGANSISKVNISKTKVRDYMHKAQMGEVSRELYVQFLFRLSREFQNLNTMLALFSKTNYLNSQNTQKFRDSIFSYKFKNGFMFSSANFRGTSKVQDFAVSFALWDMNTKQSLYNQNIVFDTFDDNANKIGEKKIVSLDKSRFLNNWIVRKKCTHIFPPLSSAIKVKTTGRDIRDRICDGFIGSLMCCGNDVIKQGFTAILSAPQACAGSLSITEDIFERAMIIHAVRRIVKRSWLNSSDQFLIPSKPIDDNIITDFVVWSLFAGSNQTASIKDVAYKGYVYQIVNHFFPYAFDDVYSWNVSENDIITSMKHDSEDRFVYKYLANRSISIEASEVLEAGRDFYKYFFESIHEVDKQKFKIDNWDVGFWQVRKALADKKLGKDKLNELKYCHNNLTKKLTDIIYNLGFLSN